MKIGFIGLGRMGMGMARNLLRAGHEVTVYNRTSGKAEALIAEGARVAESPAGACEDAEAVMTMLADDAALEAVVLGPNGIASGLGAGSIHVSHSTIGVAFSRRLAAEHSERGQGYLAVPVFGRPDAAEAKRLLVVAAGDSGAISRCVPLFDAIGRQTIVAGQEPWQANAVKLCGNFMIASMIEAFGEAFAAVRKSGVAPDEFLEVMNSLFASPVYAGYGAAIAQERFEPAGFALRLGLKDVRLMLELAEDRESPMPTASLVRDHMLQALAQGQGFMDWSSVALIPARNAGL
jgi:3-hydroxyisobutyrate dehydrogenase-like beta-hydroxyacid dehydrogenase